MEEEEEEADGWGDGGGHAWLLGDDVAVRRLPLPTAATGRGADDPAPGAGAAAPGRRSLQYEPNNSSIFLTSRISP